MKSEKKKRTAVGKAIYILKRLSEPPYEMGVTQLGEDLCMVKSGVHKLVSELVQESFLVKNVSTSKYRLGPALLRLGAVYNHMRGIEEIAKGVMETISKVTQTSVLVGLRDADEAFLAYKIDAPGSFLYQGQIGRTFPLHAGALGKVLGAYMEKHIIAEILKNKGMEKKTSLTLQSQEELFLHYQRIRERGYAVSFGENIGGAFGLAVPIFDRSKEVWACLCIAGPLELYVADREGSWVRLLREGANEISFKLGFRE